MIKYYCRISVKSNGIVVIKMISKILTNKARNLNEILQTKNIPNIAVVSEIDELPIVLPVLKISFTVLMPQSQLPLSISRDNFISAIPELLEGSVIAIVPTWFETVGCVGKVREVRFPKDEILVFIQGICRFELLEVLPEGKDTLPRIKVSYEKYKEDLNPSCNAENRENLLSTIDDFFKKFSIVQDWSTIKNTPTNVLVSAITMAFPFHPIEKQSLLKTVSLDERSKMITKIIEMNSFSRSLDTIKTIN